jgi:hypothetical protein
MAHTASAAAPPSAAISSLAAASSRATDPDVLEIKWVLCPINLTPMLAPHILKNCGHTFDLHKDKYYFSAAASDLLQRRKCHICRANFYNQQDFVPNTGLNLAIQHFQDIQTCSFPFKNKLKSYEVRNQVVVSVALDFIFPEMDAFEALKAIGAFAENEHRLFLCDFASLDICHAKKDCRRCAELKHHYPNLRNYSLMAAYEEDNKFKGMLKSKSNKVGKHIRKLTGVVRKQLLKERQEAGQVAIQASQRREQEIQRAQHRRWLYGGAVAATAALALWSEMEPDANASPAVVWSPVVGAASWVAGALTSYFGSNLLPPPIVNPYPPPPWQPAYRMEMTPLITQAQRESLAQQMLSLIKKTEFIFSDFNQIISLANHGADLNYAPRPSFSKDLGPAAFLMGGLCEYGTPLMVAAKQGRTDLINFFVKEKGVNPNQKVKGIGTALIAAASGGHLDAVDLLIRLGANVNLKVKNRISVGTKEKTAQWDATPLKTAMMNGSLEVVKRLIAANADIKQIHSWDFLINVAAFGYFEIIDYLIQENLINSYFFVKILSYYTVCWRKLLDGMGHNPVSAFSRARSLGYTVALPLALFGLAYLTV